MPHRIDDVLPHPRGDLVDNASPQLPDQADGGPAGRGGLRSAAQGRDAPVRRRRSAYLTVCPEGRQAVEPMLQRGRERGVPRCNSRRDPVLELLELVPDRGRRWQRARGGGLLRVVAQARRRAVKPEPGHAAACRHDEEQRCRGRPRRARRGCAAGAGRRAGVGGRADCRLPGHRPVALHPRVQPGEDWD